MWSIGLCFFGLIFASIFRQYFVVRENLPWPGARATAQLITTLHGGDKTEHQIVTTAQAPDSPANKNDDEIWKRKAATLFRSALLSGVLVRTHGPSLS